MASLDMEQPMRHPDSRRDYHAYSASVTAAGTHGHITEGMRSGTGFYDPVSIYQELELYDPIDFEYDNTTWSVCRHQSIEDAEWAAPAPPPRTELYYNHLHHHYYRQQRHNHYRHQQQHQQHQQQRRCCCCHQILPPGTPLRQRRQTVPSSYSSSNNARLNEEFFSDPGLDLGRAATWQGSSAAAPPPASRPGVPCAAHGNPPASERQAPHHPTPSAGLVAIPPRHPLSMRTCSCCSNDLTAGHPDVSLSVMDPSVLGGHSSNSSSVSIISTPPQQLQQCLHQQHDCPISPPESDAPVTCPGSSSNTTTTTTSLAPTDMDHPYLCATTVPFSEETAAAPELGNPSPSSSTCSVVTCFPPQQVTQQSQEQALHEDEDVVNEVAVEDDEEDEEEVPRAEMDGSADIIDLDDGPLPPPPAEPTGDPDPESELRCWDHGCDGRKFSTRGNLVRHQREKANRQSFYCYSCGACFSRTTARDKHLLNQSCSRIRRYSNGRIRPKFAKLLMEEGGTAGVGTALGGGEIGAGMGSESSASTVVSGEDIMETVSPSSYIIVGDNIHWDENVFD